MQDTPPLKINEKMRAHQTRKPKKKLGTLFIKRWKSIHLPVQKGNQRYLFNKKNLRNKFSFLKSIQKNPKKSPRQKREPPKTQLALTQPDPKQWDLTTQELIRPNEKLRQSIEAFLMDQRSLHTQRAYGKDLKRFVKYLLSRNWNQGVEKINRSLLVAYKDSLLGEGLEHTTIDRHLATLKSFFKWLIDDGLLEKNPAEGVRFLNPKRLSSTHAFTDEEVAKILVLPNLHTRSGALHYAILMVLFYCGLRRSELCELRTRNASEERGHPVIRLKGKGNAERIIFLIPPVWSSIQYYFRITIRDILLDEPLFIPIKNNRTSLKVKALDPSSIFYIVTRYARLAGILKRVSPHSCRATAISNARDHHVPDRAIQEFAGWASPDMITRYDKRKSSIENSAARSISYGIESKNHLPSGVVSSEGEGGLSSEP